MLMGSPPRPPCPVPGPLTSLCAPALGLNPFPHPQATAQGAPALGQPLPPVRRVLHLHPRVPAARSRSGGSHLGPPHQVWGCAVSWPRAESWVRGHRWCIDFEM